MFMRIAVPVCQECAKEEETSFQKLKEYLDKNSHNNITTVSKDTGIPIKRILKYIQEGRITMSEGISADNPLTCVRCGVSIKVGSLCEQCMLSYNQSLQGLKEDSIRSKNTGMGMHTAKNDDKRRR
jgi:hypothetical protein